MTRLHLLAPFVLAPLACFSPDHSSDSLVSGQDGSSSEGTASTGMASTAGVTSASGSDATGPTSAATTLSPDSTASSGGGPLCGNGQIDGDEACDAGPDNSDEVPDACRTDCTIARCGDGVTDSAEACDDANEAWGDTCYACQDHFYFILDAPSTNSSGDDALVRTSIGGETVVLAGPDVELNGMRHLAVEPDGSVVYGLQSNFGLMQQRVVAFDGETGTQLDSFSLGQAQIGFDGFPLALARGVNGLLYCLISDNANMHLVTVDPTSGATDDVYDFAFNQFVGSMAADHDGYFYVTVGGNQVLRLFPAGQSMSVWADASDGVSNPFGITFDASDESIWVANNLPSVEAQILELVNGSGSLYATIAGYAQPGTRGLLVENGAPLVPLAEYAKVVAVDSTGTATDVFTEQLHFPVDIALVVLGS